MDSTLDNFTGLQIADCEPDGIFPHPTKYSSSLPMDSSATRTKAINLGNELVNALDLEPGGNTLTRWMAHYLAEQITLVETTSGALKTAAEDRCFKTVLALWQQRSSLPSGRRPLEDAGSSPKMGALVSAGVPLGAAAPGLAVQPVGGVISHQYAPFPCRSIPEPPSFGSAVGPD